MKAVFSIVLILAGCDKRVIDNTPPIYTYSETIEREDGSTVTINYSGPQSPADALQIRELHTAMQSP